MAKWSAAREQEKKEAAAKREADRISNAVAERLDIFKAFRVAGWEAAAVTKVTGIFDNGTFRFLPDDSQMSNSDIDFRVKMPGAMAARVRIDGLRRLAKGVGYNG